MRSLKIRGLKIFSFHKDSGVYDESNLAIVYICFRIAPTSAPAYWSFELAQQGCFMG